VPQVRITDPDQYQSIVDAEWKVIYGKLDKIVATGANIVLSRLAIGDLATQSVCAPASGRPNGPSVCCSGVAYGGCAVPALGAYSCATAVYLFFSFFQVLRRPSDLLRWARRRARPRARVQGHRRGGADLGQQPDARDCRQVRLDGGGALFACAPGDRRPASGSRSGTAVGRTGVPLHIRGRDASPHCLMLGVAAGRAVVNAGMACPARQSERASERAQPLDVVATAVLDPWPPTLPCQPCTCAWLVGATRKLCALADATDCCS